MAGGLLDSFVTLLLGKAGREELDRVSEARSAQDVKKRDEKIEKMKAASKAVAANMSPERKALVEEALTVQRQSEQRVFEGMSEADREAMKEDALNQVFGDGGGLKGD